LVYFYSAVPNFNRNEHINRSAVIGTLNIDFI